ncbi:MAG: ATP-binding cassette domain-containing protein [Chloroflexota bacterium]|nr:ATP-binding cassette domain-containing protein [Chloroflexota bacterium]
MKIELRDIQKRFGTVRANDHISTTCTSGRIIGILGENGAGKSTLMKILSGFQPPDSGTVLLDDAAVRYHNPQDAIHAGIGMLQQDPLDIPAMSAVENFVYGQPGGIGFSTRAAAARLRTISTRFGFTIDPDSPVSALSIGQRQQLEIARLIALDIRALILDEPTTGISTEQKMLLFEALRALARDGVTILLVSHKLEDVIALCHEVIVLRGGRLVGAATMPASKDHLVTLMFGQSLAPQTRAIVPIGGAVAALDNVTLRDKRVTVHDLTMRLRTGEVVGMAGLEGSGQELVLRAFAGLVKPSHGHVRLGARDMTRRSYHDFQRAGVAFSAAGRLEEGLIAGLTLTEHVALVRDDDAVIDWRSARDDTAARIAHYAVRGRPDSRIEQLSGGNQQRVLMALMAPRCLLMALEQPTRGLDVDSSRWIWEQILARRSDGSAILFTSPDLDEIAAYSDRIYVAYNGTLYEVPDAASVTIDELGRLIGGDFSAQPISQSITS